MNMGMDDTAATPDDRPRTPPTVGGRIKMRRVELKLSQTELAVMSGLTQPTISALEKNRTHSTGSMARIAKALGVSALWLETGLGDIQATVYEPTAPSESDLLTIPLVECKGSCGNGRLHGDIDYSPITISARLLGRPTSTTSLLALYADGDSMASYIMDGDIVVFDTGVTDFQESGVYLIDTPDGLRVKRLSRRADGRVILRSDSADKGRYPDEEYSAEQAPSLTVKGKFMLRIGC